MEEKINDVLRNIEQEEEVWERNEQAMLSVEPIKSKFASVPRSTGKLLYSLAIAKQAKSILEIGSSVGYSTLWLARAALISQGELTSLEISPDRAKLAEQNLKAANLQNVTHLNIDAFYYLKNNNEKNFDLIFIDSFKKDYPELLALASAKLEPKGIIIFDNILSHHDKLDTFVAETEKIPELITQLLPFDNGLLIVYKK
jgi:predicted O-methyltransferase YrrM